MTPKILVIDDDKQILEAVELVLSNKGYQVLILEDPTQAVAQVRAHQPHVVLLDLYIAGSDGREVIAQLRDEGAVDNTPVVLMSADAELKEKAKTADALLKKPFDINELEQVVDSCLSKRHD